MTRQIHVREVDLHLGRTPCAPGKPRKEQHQLGWTLADGGFDQARDIEATTVNRWPHGYAYNYNTLFDPVEWSLATPDERAHVVGPKQFGRISIANADAAGSSHTDAAIDQAHRAINEVIASRSSEYVSRMQKKKT